MERTEQIPRKLQHCASLGHSDVNAKSARFFSALGLATIQKCLRRAFPLTRKQEAEQHRLLSCEPAPLKSGVQSRRLSKKREMEVTHIAQNSNSRYATPRSPSDQGNRGRRRRVAAKPAR